MYTTHIEKVDTEGFSNNLIIPHAPFMVFEISSYDDYLVSHGDDGGYVALNLQTGITHGCIDPYQKGDVEKFLHDGRWVLKKSKITIEA